MLGISSSALSRQVSSGALERVLPQVFRSPFIPMTSRQRVLAAVLWAGPDAIASHASAAVVWALEVSAGNISELWTPTDRRCRSGSVIAHRGIVEPIDRRTRDGIPVTSAARTLIDLAPRLDEEALEAAVENVLHRGLTTRTMLERRLDALGGKGRAGSSALRAVLANRGTAPLESRLEVKLWKILRRVEPRPVRQFVTRVGAKKYRLDVAWPHLKVAVEADGYVAHGGRRAFVADRQRLADLVSAGWTVFPVTWEDCTGNPEGLLQRIGAVLIRAA